MKSIKPNSEHRKIKLTLCTKEELQFYIDPKSDNYSKKFADRFAEVGED